MNDILIDGLKEIFNFRQMLVDVVFAALNSPDVYLDKVFKIYNDVVEMVETFPEFTIEDVEKFISTAVPKYASEPFFPVIAGLYIDALLNKLFQGMNEILIDLEALCFGILDDASSNADAQAKDDVEVDNKVNFSLDFLGYLLPNNKKLIIKGPVGDFCGALIGSNSTLILQGMHGNNFGYEADPSAKIIIEK
jgi:hypothetical protein